MSKVSGAVRTAHSSTSTFRNVMLLNVSENSSSLGATILQGPHHSAKKSTKTCKLALSSHSAVTR